MARTLHAGPCGGFARCRAEDRLIMLVRRAIGLGALAALFAGALPVALRADDVTWEVRRAQVGDQTDEWTAMGGEGGPASANAGARALYTPRPSEVLVHGGLVKH